MRKMMDWKANFEDTFLSTASKFLLYIPTGPEYDDEWCEVTGGKYVVAEVEREDDEKRLVKINTGEVVSKEAVQCFCKIGKPPRGYRPLDDNTEVCDKCDGTGKVECSMEFESGRVDEWTEDCYKCDQKGFVYLDD
jgi:hypothetical protein